MAKRIILLANDVPGYEICNYLVKRGEKIVRLYLHDEANRKHANEIVAASRLTQDNIFDSRELKELGHLESLKKVEADYIITVYWAYLLKEEVIKVAKEGTINFHPALLPINRGWYPHVYSIIDGTPTGVTLHAIDAKADCGPVWAQKEIPLSIYDTADTIYKKLQAEIVDLFIQSWPKISSGTLKPFKQDESKAIYRAKAAVNDLDLIDLNSIKKVEDLINLLRARSFGNRGFAYYIKNGQKVYVNMRLSETNDFKSN